MRYQVANGQAELTGSSAGTPHVVNDQMVVDAPRVEMAIEGSRLRAIGNAGAPVRTVMQPSKDPKNADRRTPGIMQQDRPINGVSGELLYVGGDASTADFVGGAQLWQDAAKGDVTRIKGDKISIESKTGNLVAVGSVIATMGVQDVNPTTKERETSRSTGQGQQMIYEDALHRVTYKTKATLVGAQGDLRGETIVLTLGANGQDVERLEATENVVLREVDRETIGDHLVYIAATGEYTMSGKGRLVRMRRNTPEGCRMSEGSVLTFSRSTDSLRIEGRVETRTQTSSDSACPPAKH
jgi:lipopolysaccharide export system protein LptA